MPPRADLVIVGHFSQPSRPSSSLIPDTDQRSLKTYQYTADGWDGCEGGDQLVTTDFSSFNSGIIKRSVDPTERQANYHVLEIIASIEDVDVTALPPMYNRVDHLLDNIFSTPPVAEANAEVTFSYYGYRVTVTQDGTVMLQDLNRATGNSALKSTMPKRPDLSVGSG